MPGSGLDATCRVLNHETQQCQILAKPISTVHISDCCLYVCHATVNDFYSDTYNVNEAKQLVTC